MTVLALVIWLSSVAVALHMGARAGGIIMTVLFSWLGFFVWMICTTIPRRVAREEADLRRQVALIQALKN